jgi:hypothetical protein
MENGESSGISNDLSALGTMSHRGVRKRFYAILTPKRVELTDGSASRPCRWVDEGGFAETAVNFLRSEFGITCAMGA